MSNYNFEEPNNKFKYSLYAFAFLLIIAVVSYLLSDRTLEDKVLKNINEQIDALESQKEEIKKETKKPISISKKKQAFLDLMLEPINEVYLEFDALYKAIKANPKDARIDSLMKQYKVDSYEELLLALKPHPRSIALAQAAMESAWATSRFFVEAKNIFGVWSIKKNEPRVPALVKRGDKTVYVRKYETIKESIRNYYVTLSRSKAFKAFRELNAQKEFQNPYLLTEKLDKYSEKGAAYGEELNDMISFNQFVRFDEMHYDKPLKEKEPVAMSQKEVEEVINVVDTVEENESSFGELLKKIKE